MPMLQVLEEAVGVVSMIPRERVQQQTAEQTEDVPQFPEETVKMVWLASHERLQQRTAERN